VPAGGSLASGAPRPLSVWADTASGLAIRFGLLARPVALILCGEMAWAHFQVHIRRSVFPINSRGDNVVSFCFVFLVFAGGGSWSIDRAIARSKRRALSGTLTG